MYVCTNKYTMQALITLLHECHRSVHGIPMHGTHKQHTSILNPGRMYNPVQAVDVVAVHGDKDQEERLAAISAFKKGQKDVLVATDVASKGLDFPGIQHVINYDMPEEIENYVHR